MKKLVSEECASTEQAQSAKRTEPSTSKNDRSWRHLYITALFERDQLKLPSRVAEAERALLLRTRELFGTPENNGEECKAWPKRCMLCGHCAIA
jgi:hypothetical protein